ncbi:ribonucleoside hydrolase RihC [Entomospira culicis]|uniref:Ribonucleoside hydrolase RihC n=1 Tax=Entomospira culicis TaxID=2719989 RepID=A0A968KUS2_9SPIO|nr:ribonucleoside hydrolase RihC [Entomospira culicis]NIZ19645.1 ribonucleoside hydrolase RihC [Entomospira culicis]NIZ69859.1 ribonucleoside hydrolase RihC [Entomospira culicis]WDI36966.1 ribonucleoside hydrolase RihC [Entomospira culicis]WDI38595.1 ribonucleoside hydrolase RihC [Entomospira culicis]
MSKRPIIIDTDPGIDDAIAIAIALFSEELDVRLITTVAGNVGLENVTNNTLKLLAFWQKDVPVAKGAARPLVLPLIDAANVHGLSGMDGYDFPSPAKHNLLSIHAVEAIYQELVSSKEKITLVPIAPLTNIALLLRMHPDAVEYIEEIVLMGGSTTRGNKGVMSEFNIATDPEAAKIVFDCGLPIVMVGLDVGWKALVYREDSDKIMQMGATGEMMVSLFQKYRSGTFNTGLKMYDPCVMAYLLQPEMFEVIPGVVDIELDGKMTKGMTIVDFRGYLGDRPKNARVCVDIDGQMFRQWLLASIAACL